MTIKEKTYSIELTERELARVMAIRDQSTADTEQWTADKMKAFVDDYEKILRLQRYGL